MRFPSKVDAWLAVLLLTTPVGLVIAALLTHVPKLLIAAAAVVAVALVLVWPCDYTLGEIELIVRCGLVRIRVPYLDIEEVQPSGSLMKAPALSLDRVEVKYRGRRLLISPVRKDEFIAELKRRVAAA